MYTDRDVRDEGGGGSGERKRKMDENHYLMVAHQPFTHSLFIISIIGSIKR